MLRWEKKGTRTWYGEDGWLRYHVQRQARTFAVARGGIACADWFSHTLTLQGAKECAQEDATKREDKLLALPSIIL